MATTMQPEPCAGTTPRADSVKRTLYLALGAGLTAFALIEMIRFGGATWFAPCVLPSARPRARLRHLSRPRARPAPPEGGALLQRHAQLHHPDRSDDRRPVRAAGRLRGRRHLGCPHRVGQGLRVRPADARGLSALAGLPPLRRRPLSPRRVLPQARRVAQSPARGSVTSYAPPVRSRGDGLAHRIGGFAALFVPTDAPVPCSMAREDESRGVEPPIHLIPARPDPRTALRRREVFFAERCL